MWDIAIPSYKRSKEVLKKTIKTLKEYNIPSTRINVFVNSDQVDEYKEVIGKEANVINRGMANNLAEARNSIINHYPKGKELIMIDDDITAFKEVRGGKLVPLSSLIPVINKGFALCKEHGFHLWGMYPVANAFYMKSDKEYSTDLKFIVGAFMGMINQKIHTLVQTSTKEDYYLSLKYYEADGGIIRFNKVAVRYGIAPKNKGDDASRERLKKNKEASEYLIKHFPDYVRANPQREGEILFKKVPLKGSGKPVMRNDPEAKADTKRLTLTIRNKERYNKAKENLLEILRKTTIPPLGKPKSGVYNRANKLGSIGRTMTFGFGDTRQGIKEYATNKKHPELLKALAEFGNSVVPLGWDYNGITLNEGVKANKHKDSKNLGPSVIIGIGDFTGGDIEVWDKDDKDPQIYKLHDKPVMFNGGLLFHQTTPFQGERYTMVFYKQMWEGDVKGVSMKGSGRIEGTLTGGIFA